MRLAIKIAAAFAAAAFLCLTAAAGEAPPGLPGERAGRLHDEAIRLLQDKKYEDSIRKYALVLKEDPEDSTALYNVACACSLMGKKDKAVAFLEKSVYAGFLDFDHIQRDSDLDPIRGEPGYKALVSRREELSASARRLHEEKLMRRYGARYSFVKDEAYGILLVTNVGEEDASNLLSVMREYSQALWKEFFRDKPAHTITVLVPRSWDDYQKEFSGSRLAAGFYNHGSRTLTVNLATGLGTMTHEWTHALHHADMDGLKQSHPIWIVEGFATLMESSRISEEGKAIGLNNGRLRELQSALKDRPERYLPWNKLMAQDTDAFRNMATIGMAYAVTRYVFLYMQEKGVLGSFYSAYRERYAEDPTGKKFVEEVLGKKIAEIEAEWKAWVLGLRFGFQIPRPPVRLGVELVMTGETGGVKIAAVSAGSCAEKAGVRPGDVILFIDGEEINGASALTLSLMRRKPGDRVVLKIRRGEADIEVEVILDPR